MKLIVGLGNPGRQYQSTRHNIGFRVVDELARMSSMAFTSSKFGGEFGQGSVGGHKAALLKPQTYMNASGTSVAPAVRFYKVEGEDLIVVHDELDLPFGRLQLKLGGGTGGHNGLESIVEHLGQADFVRVRIGIGKPEEKERVVGHVLSKFNPDEASALDEIAGRAVAAVKVILEKGLAQAMTEFNRR